MGRSGKKKKTVVATTATTTATSTASSATSTVPQHTCSNGHAATNPSFVKRTQGLKDEGNRRFQSKDYAGAIEQYDLALKFLPKSHPDTAVFHSNRAACLMQMRPVDHHAVAAECSLALETQPGFPRALLRRAKAMEALGKRDIALLDVNSLLAADPSNTDAIEFAARLLPMVKQGESNECSSSNSSNNKPSSRPSPAALGASAVRGAPISGLGPCLPSRPSVPAKKPVSPPSVGKSDKVPSVSSCDNSHALQNGSDVKTTQQHPLKAVSLKPFKHNAVSTPLQPPSSESASVASSVSLKSQASGVIQDNERKVALKKTDVVVAPVVQMRPLKLVYDHDIRLAKIPARCSFRLLREAVTKRFPSSKSVLVKYKDSDGDLVTITSTSELRLAESSADGDDSENAVKMLRLHVVEVSSEQEPILPENEEEEEEKKQAVVEVEEEMVENDDLIINSSNGELVAITDAAEEVVPIEKISGRDKQCGHTECKEAEIDDWLFEFAQLFRNHVGIDPDAHLDLHELGMELCSEALEETVTSDDAQSLFDMAAAKFQEVAALAFFNWGNVHMCAARKRISLDDSATKEVMSAQLQNAYDWVQERYALAGQKYEESLGIKPDFYEGLLALGQQHFENAKLQWSFAIANKVDLKSWDSSETIQLFNSAEEKMKAATEMWEKFEERRADELKDPNNVKIDELLKRRRKTASNVESGGESSSVDTTILQGELTPTEAAEQAAVMRSQIHLFWGNMLFERSQVEFKLGVGDWGKNLDAAVERFKLAGASESDINAVMKNHSSKEVVGAEFDEKKITHLINVAKMSIKDEEDKHVLEG